VQVLVLTPYRYGTTPGPRSSFELWEPVLAEAGIQLSYEVFETERLHEILYHPGRHAEKAVEMARAYAGLAARLRRLEGIDAVLVNREAALIGPAVLERWIHRRGVPLLYLLDDPLYIPYRSPSNGILSYLKFFGKVGTLCRISAAVLANSPSNVAFARRHNGNVWDIPSVVDAERYDGWKPRSPAANGRVCVGWTGSSSTARNLEVIRQPLAEVSLRDDTRVRFIGAGDLSLPGVRAETSPWSPDTEVEDLRQFDVGLLPLPLTAWTPHKFYLKLVQYMSLGIPPVATPLGANPTVIEDGETGFLARDDREWTAIIERLIDDPELRERVGRRAAEEAQRRYTLQANAEKIVAAFRSAVAR
jgi:glycosyltransferase involved in cell wall biosynthesis